jgi:hypothetical protein
MIMTILLYLYISILHSTCFFVTYLLLPNILSMFDVVIEGGKDFPLLLPTDLRQASTTPPRKSSAQTAAKKKLGS